MIDLQQFCSTEETRLYLMRPWSRGDWTWATNGHICVRVPRLPDFDENDVAPDCQKVWDKIQPDQELGSAPEFSVPEKVGTDCDDCLGSGLMHTDCKHCTCPCDYCDGLGQIFDSNKWISIDGVALALRYARQIFALPGLKIPLKVIPVSAMPFSFDGGDGVLMPATCEMPDALVVRP